MDGFIERIHQYGEVDGKAIYNYNMDIGLKKIKIKKEKKRRSEELKEAFKDLF